MSHPLQWTTGGDDIVEETPQSPVESSSTKPVFDQTPPIAHCGCIAKLVRKMSKLRREECNVDVEPSYALVKKGDRHAWTKLFAEYFLVNSHCTSDTCTAHSQDDMIWYVKQNAMYYTQSKQNPLQVFRRTSTNQPCPGDAGISWEDTVYLNLILHQIHYTVTVAVCTKTSPQNLQILRKNSQRVFPSPSRRRMDSKGECEEIAYPSLYFCIDDFESVFADVAVRDGECVCVELVARDHYRTRESAVFLGSIRYEVLKQVYDTKASSSSTTWQWAQQLVRSTTNLHRRKEFVRMRGPHGKGYAEMAVARVPGMGFETPMGGEQEEDRFREWDVGMGNRRSSDTFLNRQAHMSSSMYRQNYGQAKPSTSRGPPSTSPSANQHSMVKKCQSEADSMNQYPEVRANGIDDEFDESTLGNLWGVRGFGQAWHWLREKKREECTPLNAYLTYVTLPACLIIEDLLENPRRPMLSFDMDAPTHPRT